MSNLTCRAIPQAKQHDLCVVTDKSQNDQRPVLQRRNSKAHGKLARVRLNVHTINMRRKDSHLDAVGGIKVK